MSSFRGLLYFKILYVNIVQTLKFKIYMMYGLIIVPTEFQLVIIDKLLCYFLYSNVSSMVHSLKNEGPGGFKRSLIQTAI